MHSWTSKEKKRECSFKRSIILEHFLMRIRHILSLSLAFSFMATTGYSGLAWKEQTHPLRRLGSPSTVALANVDTFFVTRGLMGGGRAAHPRPGRIRGGHGRPALVLTSAH